MAAILFAITVMGGAVAATVGAVVGVFRGLCALLVVIARAPGIIVRRLAGESPRISSRLDIPREPAVLYGIDPVSLGLPSREGCAGFAMAASAIVLSALLGLQAAFPYRFAGIGIALTGSENAVLYAWVAAVPASLLGCACLSFLPYQLTAYGSRVAVAGTAAGVAACLLAARIAGSLWLAPILTTVFGVDPALVSSGAVSALGGDMALLAALPGVAFWLFLALGLMFGLQKELRRRGYSPRTAA